MTAGRSIGVDPDAAALTDSLTTAAAAEPSEASAAQLTGWTRIAGWLGAVGLIYLLICAVSIMSRGFRGMTTDAASSLFAFADHALVALAVGVLITVLVQSSTTKTAITVTAVGAGALSVRHAIPIMLGANIGTAVTGMIVALGFAGERESFRRALTGAGINDWFNILAVLIFFPIELLFHPLESISRTLTHAIDASGLPDPANFDVMRTLTHPVVSGVTSATGRLNDTLGPLVAIIIGVLMIFVVVRYLGGLLKLLMIGRARDWLQAAVGRGDARAMAAGTGATVVTQSSTVTNTIMIPFVGAGILTPRQTYPVTLGAGLGTTLTSVLAAFAITGAAANLALQTAFVHVLFNVFAIAVVFGIPFLRPIPVRCAAAIANAAAERGKWVAALYVITVYLLLPVAVIAVYAIF